MSGPAKRRTNKRFTASGKQAAIWLFQNGVEAAEGNAEFQQQVNHKPSRRELADFEKLFDEVVAKRDDDEGDDGGKYSDRWNNLP